MRCEIIAAMVDTRGREPVYRCVSHGCVIDPFMGQRTVPMQCPFGAVHERLDRIEAMLSQLGVRP